MQKILAVLCVAVCCGCSMQRSFTYPMEPITQINSSPPDVRIAVIPAEEFRPTRNRSATVWLYLIPLMPLGWMSYERPEAATTFVSIGSFDVSMYEDIPKAIAQHLQRAGYAKSVFFDYGGQTNTADYVLETKIRSSVYKGKIYSYGLSAYGPILWFFGFPAGSSTVELFIDLELRDRDGKILWSDSIIESEGFLQGLYYNFGRDMEGLSVGLQRGISRVIADHPLP